MKLPTGWTATTLRKLGGTVGGKTPSKAVSGYWTGGTIPWVSPKDMKIFKIAGSEDKITHQALIGGAMNLLPADSVLMVTRSGILAHTFPVAITGCAVTINQDIKAVRPSSAFNSKWLAYSLRAQSATILGECTKAGTTVASVEMEALESLPIPMPPLPEQTRIADKLDTALTRVDACRDRLARVAPLLKRFRQSVLAAATSGRLTEEWRVLKCISDGAIQIRKLAEPYAHEIIAPATWKYNSFDEVIDLVGGSQPPKSTFTSVEAEDVIRLIQIRDYKTEKYKTFIPRNLAKRFCGINDVMIGRYGPPIFQILRGLEGAYNVALMKAVPKGGQLDLNYLYYFLQGTNLLKYVEAGSDRTAGQDGVRKELLTSYPVFVPTLAEQTEIVRRVETLFAFADRLEARLKTAQTAADRLTPALLAKAFRGELVLQDPNDEPAAELLKRLAASRDAAPKARRGRRSATADTTP